MLIHQSLATSNTSFEDQIASNLCLLQPSLTQTVYDMHDEHNPMSLGYIAPVTALPKPRSFEQILPPLSKALKSSSTASRELSTLRLPSLAELDLFSEPHQIFPNTGSCPGYRRYTQKLSLGPWSSRYDKAFRSSYQHNSRQLALPPSPPLSPEVAYISSAAPYGRRQARSPDFDYRSDSTSYSREGVFHSSNEKLGQSAGREDRPEYDLEERFAMVYLRFQSDSTCRWKDVVEAWKFLFPPGQPRRASAPFPPGKTLPSTYHKRSNGALQCRYYRARGVAGMETVRQAQKTGTATEAKGLFRMEAELVQHWYKRLDMAERNNLGLVRRQGESDSAYMARVRSAYHQNSQFWLMLRSVPGLHHRLF